LFDSVRQIRGTREKGTPFHLKKDKSAERAANEAISYLRSDGKLKRNKGQLVAGGSKKVSDLYISLSGETERRGCPNHIAPSKHVGKKRS